MVAPLEIDHAGWCSGAVRVTSPNFDRRPAESLVELVVIHAISLPPGQFGGEAVGQLFTNELDPAAHPYYAEIYELRVSAHFFIRRNGQLVQFVSCHDRAWHAGVSSWRARERCNDFSIGIELEGDDETIFEQAQYQILNELITELRRAFPILDVVGHCDIAPGRKTDPGSGFDWQRITQR